MWQHKNVLNNEFEIFLIYQHYDVLYEDYDLYMYQISWSLFEFLLLLQCTNQHRDVFISVFMKHVYKIYIQFT